ncbi:MAG: RloB domain-containing protein [Prevotellaceae bacterium]|nr:RloB domain-containing protein [Candidatus Faecinaster equi]
MARKVNKKELLDKQRIAIICEGTETERPYFEEMVKLSPTLSTDDVLIYPIKSEKKTGSLKENGDYYPGVHDEAYSSYSYEPMRWVRAAELIISKEKCTEGWAVYDADNNQGGRSLQSHKNTIDHSQGIKNLYVAFSSYSFEEWFLLHYERNSKDFHDSECTFENSKGKNEKVNCGSKNCTNPNDCKGEKCLGGYLRHNSLLEIVKDGKTLEFQKGLGREYARITKDMLHQACVNAAWSRVLEPTKKSYECNPYTDVDQLVMKLLNDKWEVKWNICWWKVDCPFSLGGESFRIVCIENDIYIHYEGTNPVELISRNDIYWCDGNLNSNYSAIAYACDSKNINFSKSKDVKLLNKPNCHSILCVKRNNQEYYFEIH